MKRKKTATPFVLKKTSEVRNLTNGNLWLCDPNRKIKYSYTILVAVLKHENKNILSYCSNDCHIVSNCN